VPAPASSPILPVADQLAGLDLPDPVQIAACLRDALERVVDLRARRGVRHGLVAVLAAAVCAVAAGAPSFVAIAEWVADLPAEVTDALGGSASAASAANSSIGSSSSTRGLFQAPSPTPRAGAGAPLRALPEHRPHDITRSDGTTGSAASSTNIGRPHEMSPVSGTHGLTHYCGLAISGVDAVQDANAPLLFVSAIAVPASSLIWQVTSPPF
jgi:hypothetical protein